MEEIKLKCDLDTKKVKLVGNSLTACHIDSALELINCNDVNCFDCPFDSLHGCTLIILTNLLENIE